MLVAMSRIGWGTLCAGNDILHINYFYKTLADLINPHSRRRRILFSNHVRQSRQIRQTRSRHETQGSDGYCRSRIQTYTYGQFLAAHIFDRNPYFLGYGSYQLQATGRLSTIAKE